MFCFVTNHLFTLWFKTLYKLLDESLIDALVLLNDNENYRSGVKV